MKSLEALLAHRERRILFECTAGSRAYGTATASSDEDVRGIFAVEGNACLDLTRPPDQLGDERGNVVYCSLRRAIELSSVANPNILELLFMPRDCVRTMSPEMGRVLFHRPLGVAA